MKKLRVRGIIVNRGKIILIHRIKFAKEYFVFPGGGVEEKEDPISALERECREELGVVIKVEDKIYDLNEKNGRVQSFYRCSIKTGKLGTGKGPEFLNDRKDYSGFYLIKKIPLKEIGDIQIYPNEIRNKLHQDLTNLKDVKKIPYRKIYEK